MCLHCHDFIRGRNIKRCLMAGLASSVLMLASCDRESRSFPAPADGKTDQVSQRESALQPNQQHYVLSSPSPSVHAPLPTDYGQKYEKNAYAISQGRKFYRWYNCNGCHANGGGDIGPPLMDDHWIYGGEPADIYATLLNGRPNGMPAFGGHIPQDQLLQIVAYVRSMSGQLRLDVAPSRPDALSPAEPESRREKEDISNTNTPRGTP